MFNFFIDKSNFTSDGYVSIVGKDFNHIKNVLRMRIGEQFLVSYEGSSNLCQIENYTEENVVAKILQENFQDTSLPIEIYLFQGVPKSDKLELIVQKTVELGVDNIIPVEMSRSIAKIEEKKKQSKTQRWQLIAESAAKQSKRTLIPKVFEPISFKQSLAKMQEMDLLLVPYESKNGMSDTLSALKDIKKGYKIGVVIGPEGGFEQSEINALTQIGGKTISLGKRILRTETASITAIGMLMLYAETSL